MLDNNKTMESNNNIYNDGVFAALTFDFGDEIESEVIFRVCTKFNWNCKFYFANREDDSLISIVFSVDDCKNYLKKIRSQNNIGNKTKVENDMDMVVESEEIQNNAACSKNLNELQHGFSNIGIEGTKGLDNQPFSYAGAIKKTNRISNNLIDVVDSPRSLERTPSRFHDREQLQKIANEILEGFKVMVIMRGPPGCGKSHLAKELVDATTRDECYNHIFSTDNFFYDRNGSYNFNALQLGEAHESNRKRVDQYARSGWSPIIVDNTNIRVWEMSNYFEIAVRCGYLIHTVEPNTSWSRSAGKLAMKNSHGVLKDAIERMLTNYEPTTVQSVMQSFGLNYSMPMPQYRQFPPIKITSNQPSETNQKLSSKPQRTSKGLPKRNNFEMSSQIPDVVQYESVEEAFRNVDKTSDWSTFDKEQTEFWNANTNTTELPQLFQLQPKLQRIAKQASDVKSSTVTNDEVHSNLFAILKDSNETIENKSSTDEEPKEMLILHKHRKNCKNENDSFAQIRSIYPSVALEVLWDLFEKCEGDGDWTMDILLKEETRIGDYDKSIRVRAKNDFECDCDYVHVPASIEEIPIMNNALPYQRPKRDRGAISSEGQLAAKRMIEESFQISDEHYSNHTRKIRDHRRGVHSPVILPQSAPSEEEGACAIDEIEQNEEELLEINLGMDLVCQLDSVFGVDHQREAIADMKTAVFMPKSLAQQLYALWMESMYNQIEEQRKKSIKEDSEFARQLQSQQNYPGLYKHAKPPSDLKDIMEMEYAWAAYKTEIDEWKLKTPQDLALQMSHDKLCDIFPNIDRETLIEVLAAHNNKFTETVDVLKDTLSGKSEDKILNEGRELFEEVRAEVEMTVSTWN